MRRVLHILVAWLPIAVVSVGLCGLVYVAVQQVLRQGANDPQVQLAEDGARALAQGGTVERVVPTTPVDVAQSLTPFLIVYDARGQALASSGLLQGRIPAMPGGVLDYARQHGQNRLTWEPQRGVRIAAVIVSYGESGGGYVLAGRSLREVERRESQAEGEAGGALVLILAATLAVVALGEMVGGKNA
jgi:hypothetical protein